MDPTLETGPAKDAGFRSGERTCDHIALVTSNEVRRKGNSDVLLEKALYEYGVRTSWCVWDDVDTLWDSFSAIFVRKCWDYHLRYDEFVRWIRWHDNRGRILINSPTALLWGSHKQYLLDLAMHGLDIPESRILTDAMSGSMLIEDVCDSFGTRNLIIKPLVSASAYWTWRVTSVPFPVSTARLDWLMARGGALVQRFLPEVRYNGEISLIFCGDRYLYAVQRLPGTGDFRTQPAHGATTMLTEPSSSVFECARAAYQSAPGKPCYGRVDVVETESGPVIMEVELVEPDLFLGFHPSSATVIANAIVDAI